MFTNNDFREYFRQIRNMENKMADLYEKTANELLPGEYRDFFMELVHEESIHDESVADLESFFTDKLNTP